MAKNYITLDKDLGVNPRLVKIACQVCGGLKDSNDLVLLGASNFVDTCSHCGIQVYGGSKRGKPCPKCGSVSRSKHRRLNDSEPIINTGICDECQEFMKIGIVLVETANEPGEGVRPQQTGTMSVIKEEAAKRILPAEIIESVLAQRVCMISTEAWDKLGLPREDHDYREEETPDEASEETGGG